MTNPDAVTTRFAPSPTGYLHIGGARTALFNWLYARGRGGKFLLRIEDTDRERSTPEATQAILDGLNWLGLDWDGEPVSQYARAERHREVVAALMEKGAAYRCYVTPEELEDRRARAKAALDHAREIEAAGGDAAAARAEADTLMAAFRSPYRDGAAPPAPDAPFVVRLKAPMDGETVVDDVVQGPVRFANKDIDDLVLTRSDGAPTYNLAVVADDHDMGVTHVIRGDDHLVNAARQTVIYRALGWATPVFAHIPLIHGDDGKKLSKRHGALGVEAYRDMGYLPEAMRAYLLRLGWSKGDQEIFDDAEARAAFDITGVNKAPARLDFAKMASVNAHFMAAAEPDRLAELAIARLRAARDGALAETETSRVRALTPHLRGRAQTIADLAEGCAFALAPRPIAINDKARKALDAAAERLSRLRARLAAADVWEEDALKALLESFAADEEVGFGKFGPGLRAALSGGLPAPDLAAVLSVLGRDEVLGRLDDALASANASA